MRMQRNLLNCTSLKLHQTSPPLALPG